VIWNSGREGGTIDTEGFAGCHIQEYRELTGSDPGRKEKSVGVLDNFNSFRTG